MSNILDQWEAQARVVSKWEDDKAGIRTFAERILSLIELLRKKDEALNHINRTVFDPTKLFFSGEVSLLAEEALALTESLK